MAILLKLILFLTMLYMAHSGLNDVKIYINTVPKNIETHIFSFIFNYLENADNLTEIGQLLVVDLNNHYGKSWYALAGVNGTFDNIAFKSEQNTSFWFSYYDEHFFIYKPLLDTRNFTDIVKEAKISGVNEVHNYILNSSELTSVKTWITESLNQANYCGANTLSAYGDSVCYHEISYYLKEKVRPWSYNWKVFVGERYAMAADFETEAFYASFTVGNLIIIITRNHNC